MARQNARAGSPRNSGARSGASQGKRTARAGSRGNRSNTAANRKNSGTGRSGAGRSGAAARSRKPDTEDSRIGQEILFLVVLAFSILLFLSNFGLSADFGVMISSFFFGLFGLMEYVFPVLLFFGFIFVLSNKGNPRLPRKMTGAVGLFLFICAFFQLLIMQYDRHTRIVDLYVDCARDRSGGGLAGGILVQFFGNLFGTVGAYVCVLTGMVIFSIIMTQEPLLRLMKSHSEQAYRRAKENRENRRAEKAESRDTSRRRRGGWFRDADEDESDSEEEIDLGPAGDLNVSPAAPGGSEEVRPDSESDFERGVRYTGKKRKKAVSSGKSNVFNIWPDLKKKQEGESTFADEDFTGEDVPAENSSENTIRIHGAFEDDDEPAVREEDSMPAADADEAPSNGTVPSGAFSSGKDGASAKSGRKIASAPGISEKSDALRRALESARGSSPHKAKSRALSSEKNSGSAPASQGEALKDAKEKNTSVRKAASGGASSDDYEFPPLSLMKAPSPAKTSQADLKSELQQTADKLQQTLHEFGVEVQVTDVSCGPTVTRYELHPEHGVKVSRITSLQDDIKLSLAAADIRIEAPIPGKAAVGVEVPNKSNSTVMLRELLESRNFRQSRAKIPFAVGKDIGGKVVVSDIAKMPHLLIAGATGSGKSVCINTLIVSILYRCNPEDVKFIMIDPKMVELSVYNGIPHLYIPVVTDPKKAAGALNWAVSEMTDRYSRFAELGVREIDGYNAKIKELPEPEDGSEKPKKMPRIVIIVDELADLMMVAQHEVEDAIVRLSQLARAAGIHLVIATQRPSVNVITGLIKANMPSRIALAVTSGVDSRTILDRVGAEKLLGKGDMLFHPLGYQNPVRVQGAFVSDDEISAIVSFLTEKNEPSGYDTEVEQKINESAVSGESSVTGGGEKPSTDVYFERAGRLIIEKDRASIGMLQRAFKIGFNRAARIMDQLCDAGVVGEEEGTKPRRILMTMADFQNYVNTHEP